MNKHYFPHFVAEKGFTMENEILSLLAAYPSGVTFQDLAKIDGFSGDTTLDVGIASGVRDIYNIYAWPYCSNAAAGFLEKLAVEEVIIVAPIRKKIEVLGCYNNGVVPGFPIVSKKIDPFKPYWLPCTVRKGPNFEAYIRGMASEVG